jgi:hypothetical protein
MNTVPLHDTLHGFSAGLKALQPGGTALGGIQSPGARQFISAHLNHPPFLRALQTAHGGEEIHKDLAFLASRTTPMRPTPPPHANHLPSENERKFTMPADKFTPPYAMATGITNKDEDGADVNTSPVMQGEQLSLEKNGQWSLSVGPK